MRVKLQVLTQMGTGADGGSFQIDLLVRRIKLA